MPPFEAFRDAESYYAALAHECTHWTRHKSRLDRDFGRKNWGDAGYAMEELVAELGSAFLCADLDLTPEIREDHAAYIANWLEVLKNDKRAIFSAAAHAQKAADYLTRLQANDKRTGGGVKRKRQCTHRRRGLDVRAAGAVLKRNIVVERAEPAMQVFPLFRRVVGQLLGCFDHLLQ